MRLPDRYRAGVSDLVSGSRTALLESLIERFPNVPPEAVLKEDLLRTGMAFDASALSDNLEGEIKPKSYFIFSFDQKPLAELGEAALRRPPEELALTGGPFGLRRTIVSVRVNPGSPYRVAVTEDGTLGLSVDGRPLADVHLPPMPEYYRHLLANGKTVMETAPTIQWGYLIYLTVLRLCQYFGAKEECGFCDINHNWRQHKREGRPYTGVKPIEDVLEALALIDRYDTAGTSKAYTLTGGSVTSSVDGLGEAEFYGRYAQAIEERFPGRWLGKVVAQALPKADVQRFKDYGISIYHPNYEVWDKRLFSLISPGKERYVGREEWHRRIFDAAEVFGAALRDPELRRRRRDGEAVRVRDGRRGDREHDRGARLLHEPRDHAALHDLVPGADDAARPGQPRGCAARVPRPAPRGVSRRALPPRPQAAARVRRRRRRERRLLGELVHGHARPGRGHRRGGGAGVSRISVDEAARLWNEASDDELRELAGAARARWHEPDRATYMVMRIINYTNVCVAQCDYCAFYVLPGQDGGYVLDRDEVFAKIDGLLEAGGDLVGFNGGFNPKLPLDYYCELFAAVRERYQDRVEFYALTVAEFMYLADRAELSYAETAARLRDAGVYWVTGGGSEILTEDFRKRHAKFKYTVAQYFEAQRAIVESGMRTTATMVIGFDETLEERLEHLQRTRDFQDDCLRDGLTGLFSFLSWTYKPYGTALGGREIEPARVLAPHRALAHLPRQRQAHPDVGADPERGRLPRARLRRRRLRPADRGRGDPEGRRARSTSISRACSRCRAGSATGSSTAAPSGPAAFASRARAERSCLRLLSRSGRRPRARALRAPPAAATPSRLSRARRA